MILTVKKQNMLKISALFFVFISLFFCGFYQFFASMGGVGCLSMVSQAAFFKNTSFGNFIFAFVFAYFLIKFLRSAYPKKDKNIFFGSVNFLILIFWTSLYKVFFSLFYAIEQGRLSPQIYNR